MIIRTTINIEESAIERVFAAASLMKMTRNEVISSVVHLAGRRVKGFPPEWKRVRYQERRGPGDRQRFHMSLKVDEYEFFIDLRKVWKMSVSFIIAMAVDQYLDELLGLLNKGADNYRYRNYVIAQAMVDNTIYWLICWGFPQIGPARDCPGIDISSI